MSSNLFPASESISPSVRLVERDFSTYTAGFSLSHGAMVGFATKGPFNTPITVRTRDEFFANFGYPDSDVGSFLALSAIEFLRNGRDLTVVRVGISDPGDDEQAQTAYVEVESAGSQASLVSDITGEVTIPTGGLVLRVRANGSQAIRQFTLAAGTYDLVGDTDSVEALLVAQLQDSDAIEITRDDDDHLVFKTKINGSTGTIEAVSAAVTTTVSEPGLGSQPDASGNPNLRTVDFWQDIMGINLAATRAGEGDSPLVGTNAYWPLTNSAGMDFDLNSYENLNLKVVVYGTGDTAVDGVIQTVYLPRDASGANLANTTLSDIVDAINEGTYAVMTGEDTGDPDVDFTAVPPVGFLAYESGDYVALKTLHFGRDARILVRSESTADTILGIPNTTFRGTTESTTEDVAVDHADRLDAGIVDGVDGDGSTISFTINGSTAGTENNQTTVIVTRNESGTFNLQVLQRGLQVESFNNMTKDETDVRYIETYVNELSNYIAIEDNTDTSEGPAAGTYALGATDETAGTNGIPAATVDYRAAIIGDAFAKTGIYSLSNPEQYDVDLIAVPGVSDTAVIEAGLDVCELRKDCLFIVDPPQGLEPWEVIAWHNGQHPLNASRFDSNRLALFWPWLEGRDNFNKVNVTLPPSGFVMGQFAYSDSVEFPWFAAAGTQRGQIESAIDVETNTQLTDRDSMYGLENAVNPIIKYVGDEGGGKPTIWGNKTLQRRKSALNSINVRRMLFYVEKRISRQVRSLLFGQNDDITRQSFIDIANDICNYVKSNRGMDSFVVVCDDTINTPDVIQRKELRARIAVFPTNPVEFIFIEVTNNSSGSFEETDETSS